MQNVVDFSATKHLEDDEWLNCPKCGEGYLHQETVKIFNRCEDNPNVTLICALDECATLQNIPNNNSRNPSSRRQGVVIEFYCECCDNSIELTIAQHKGCTQLGWRF